MAERGELDKYLDKELMMLQHFKYKELFLRKSKNAYISFVTQDLHDLVLENKPKLTYSGLATALNVRGFYNPLNSLRKLNATTLREHFPAEIIDLLQGRVSESVFLRYYYKPVLGQIREKTLEALAPLQSGLLTIMENEKRAVLETRSTRTIKPPVPLLFGGLKC